MKNKFLYQNELLHILIPAFFKHVDIDTQASETEFTLTEKHIQAS